MYTQLRNLMHFKNYKKIRYLYYAAVAVLVLLSTFLTETAFLYEHHRSHTAINELTQNKNSEQINPASGDANNPNGSVAAASAISDNVASSRVPVLMYHHIKTNTDPRNEIEAGLDVPPEYFEQQILSLKDKGYQAINISQLFQNDQSKKIILTFDDGYKDIITNAYPILQNSGYTASVYIISDYTGRDGYLNWDDIRTLKNAGWEIGSHTTNHPDLTKVSLDEARSEIVNSKSKIETEIGGTISSFCYPSGKYNSDIEQLVQQAGYLNAATTKSGRSNTQQLIFELKRIRISGNETIDHFKKAF